MHRLLLLLDVQILLGWMALNILLLNAVGFLLLLLRRREIIAARASVIDLLIHILVTWQPTSAISSSQSVCSRLHSLICL